MLKMKKFLSEYFLQIFSYQQQLFIGPKQVGVGSMNLTVHDSPFKFISNQHYAEYALCYVSL